jgi:ubiquinone/menaquinone biosynthesis C-methylase UbiE
VKGRSLADSFRRLIAATGPISVAQFMSESNARYYAANDPLGSEGDFITAPEISPMFGELIGLWLADGWIRAGRPDDPHYLELGPGRGTLARDALRAMKRYGLEPEVHLIEGSTELKRLQLEAVPEGANLGVGCGAPLGHAALRTGETVLDLGSGAGFDAFLAAREVGPGGHVIGVDMTPEMIELATRHAAAGEYANVEFRRGLIEKLPVTDASVDVVISNCVINLAADKRVVLAEAARVLRPGGRFAVSDVIADEGMDDATRADMAQWTGCIAGALTEAEFRATLAEAGFTDIEIRPTHRVHEHAGSAIVRARKP